MWCFERMRSTVIITEGCMNITKMNMKGIYSEEMYLKSLGEDKRKLPGLRLFKNQEKADNE